MTFEESSEQILELSRKYEESANPEDKELNHRFLMSAAKRHTDKCNALLEKNAKMLALGYVDELYAESVESMVAEEKAKTEFLVFPYLEAGLAASALKIAYKEVEFLAMKIMNSVLTPTIGKGINSAERKFISKRLNRYTLLHEDAVDFQQLESDKFTLEELSTKHPQIKFKFVEKWIEKGKQFNCEVYFYKNKPVSAIAYSRSEKAWNDGGESALVECTIVDSKFKKHEDYYTACMSTRKQLSHPAISRVLKKLKEEWKRELEKQKKEAQESVADAYIDGKYDTYMEYVTECVEHNIIDEKTAENYRVQMLRSEFKI